MDKAVYSYPEEHYRFWQKELICICLGYVCENFTTEGLFEDNVNIDHSDWNSNSYSNSTEDAVLQTWMVAEWT